MSDLWTDRLSEFLDRELSPADSAALETHLQSCAECRDTLADLRRVVSMAQALDDRAPAADLWPGVAALVGGDRPERRGWSRRIALTVPQLIAAGIALMLMSGGVVALIERPTSAAHLAGAPTTAPNSEVMTVGSNPPARTAVGYDGAVNDLQDVLRDERGHLDTATVRTIDENLQRIDRAIAQAQHALAADPGSVYLSNHLNQTRMRKLDLLRRAAALASAAS
ncbi:MAG: zf-HC2 domain-containing protein [Gemmatimonadota bacterium]